MTLGEQRRLFDAWSVEFGAILHRAAGVFATDADRDDLHQELLLALWHAIPAFRGDSRASTFVYRVVHNRAMAWRRDTRERAPRDPSADVASTPARPPSDNPAHDSELLDAVYAHIRSLPPVDRSLLTMSLDGLGYEEIGAVHGLRRGAVGVRLHRLRKRLAADLGGKIDD